MQYFLYLLALPFLFINYKIIFSDLKNKIIPNKYLTYLLFLIPFYYIYIFFQFPEINYLFFLLQILLTFLISFILYYFGIWAAGDAKYLLVLSLFIPYIGIIPFIGNIALITILYLLGYFIYFYLAKLVFNKKYRQSLWQNIKQDLNDAWQNNKKNKGGNTYKIIAKFLLIFLVIFVSIRLIRIYLFNSFLENGTAINHISEIIQKYNIYLIVLSILIFIGGLYFFKILINKFKIYINKKLNLNLELIGNILIIFLFLLLISFISYELINNYIEISNLLFRIFTIYLLIYIIVKVLIYSYKITFGIGEIEYININKLSEGDVIEKEWLIKRFGKQVSPSFIKSNKKLDNKILITPTKFFTDLNKSITNNEINTIKKFLKSYNIYHKEEKTDYYKESDNIKILKTFSFGPYIFLGFLITLLLQDKIFINISNFFIEIIKKY